MNSPDIGAQLHATGIAGAHLPPIASSSRYRLGLTLGALLSGVFSFVYLGLIPLVTWRLYLLVSRVHSLVGSLALLVSGCVLILSFLKPLLARPGRAAEPYPLDPDQQPLLFAFLRELAAKGGMPEPARISVDCGVNCSCVFAGGITGLFRSDLDLVIGLPLVAGLRMDELAGVLAHELGHAAQTTAIWSSRFIWSVNAWFSRVAFERDAVDERILQALETAGPGTRVAWLCAQLLVLPGRGVLQMVKIVKDAATSVFLRRMEREADRYQLHVAGTEAFVSTILEINVLSVAAQRVVVDLSRMWQEGRLVDNYPGLIASVRDRYSKGFVQRLLAGLEQGKTSIFSAHPCDKDRMILARAEEARGVLTLGLPAAVLFADYEALCREVTLELYDQQFHIKRESCDLVPLHQVLQERESGP